MPDNNSTLPIDTHQPSDPAAAGLQPVIIKPSGAGEAADLIRAKLTQIYADEPNAERELAESEAVKTRSPHQHFMHQLSQSGKDLATIQTEWHNYYLQLDDTQKHQVWQEFYANGSTARFRPLPTDTGAGNDGQATSHPSSNPHAEAEHKHGVVATGRRKDRASSTSKQASKPQRPRRDLRSPAAIRTAIRDQVSAGGKLKAKHHLKSLAFGLAVGMVFIGIVMFGFFNEVIIAPFIQPSRAAAATPVIVSTSSLAVSSEPQIIIPKINVQIPVDYGQTSVIESDIQSGLEKGIVHYPTTVKPGEQGNAAFFGHSSNNIFNKGKYKFAFVLLHTLVEGDTFYVQYNSKLYVYKVISRQVVEPSQVDVLNNIPGKLATATLITCDPPGTSLKRLVVVGEQISPSPTANTVAAAPTAAAPSVAALPGNGPTLASRLLQTTIGKTISIMIVIILIGATLRWATKKPRPAYQ